MVLGSKPYQKFIIAFALVMLVLTASSNTFGRSWRDVRPLHSTAQDVRRLFPACEEKETGCYLALEDREVTVIFSGGKIGLSECKGVPKGTVLAVIVRFRSPRKLQEFTLKRERFTVFDPSNPPKRGYKTYYYARDGFMINTYRGKAIELVYLAAKKDIPLCPDYYKDPKGFVEVGLIP